MKKIILSLCLIVVSLNIYNPLVKNSNYDWKKYYKNRNFSIQNLKEYVSLSNFDAGDIVLRQAILESAWGKSYRFKENNNLFGMRHPKVRQTSSIGNKDGYANYNHWTDSVDDYLYWQKYHSSKIAKYSCYLDFLQQSGYAEDLGYINKLKRIKV